MNVRFLTLHHKLTCSMVQPTHVNSNMNLPLVIGTSNNLYKAMKVEERNATGKINTIIVEMWLEKIDFVLEKIESLEKQFLGHSFTPPDSPLYFRVEYIDSNEIAICLADVFERLDKILMTLMQFGDGFETAKYERFLLYFGDKLSELMGFPYQRNQELHQRILQSEL